MSTTESTERTGTAEDVEPARQEGTMSNENSCVLRRFIIVKSPGMAPEKKVPRNTDEGVAVMLRGLMERRPDAEMLVVRLVFGGDIWVDEASAFLAPEPCHVCGGKGGCDNCENTGLAL